MTPEHSAQHRAAPGDHSTLVRLLGELLAADVRAYPDGPPADASATSGPRTHRTSLVRNVYGRLHDDVGAAEP